MVTLLKLALSAFVSSALVFALVVVFAFLLALVTLYSVHVHRCRALVLIVTRLLVESQRH